MSKVHHLPDSKATFKETMEEVTELMPLRQRLFSRLIHSTALSSISSLIGSTLARPNALLAGAVTSFGVTLSAYLLAKNLGYSLSGFESIGGFTFGWLLGLLYDLLKAGISGKR